MIKIPHFIEFDKKTWVKNVRSLAREQEIGNDQLRWLFQCCEKTLGRYLNEERPELPKIPQLVRAFQGLNSSPGHILIDRGPRLIDPKSALKLFDTMERMADTSRPTLRISVFHISQMDEKKLRKVNKLLEAFNKLKPNTQEKVLSSLLNLIPG